jgi:hypothetical protein
MKKGIKTTEFWLVVIGAAVTVANDGLGLGLERDTIMAFAAMVASYVGGRSYIKAKHPEA